MVKPCDAVSTTKAVHFWQASAFFMRSPPSTAQDRQLQHESLGRQLARPELSGLRGNRCVFVQKQDEA